ncbi:FemAB family XrtA/PEP-CTERM system-associated protein [Paraglaciecola aestuariivivens]
MELRTVVASDQAQWDNYVSQHQDSSPYHRFAWLQSIEQAYQHPNSSVIAIDQGEVVGVLPCVAMQKPWAKVSYCSLPYCDLGHALANNPSIVQGLQHFALAQLAQKNGQSFEYRDTHNHLPDGDLTGQKVRMLLTLPDTADDLMASFKSKLRSQIRKAEKNGLHYQIATSPEKIHDFYQIFAINMRKLGSPVHSKAWFEALLEHYAEHIILSVVYKDSTPVGAGIVLLNGKKAAIPWASTVAQYNKLAPNMLLYWSLLEYVIQQGYSEFDFGRSTYNEGTYKFKRQWGAEPMPLAWSNLVAEQPELDKNTSLKVSKIRTLVEKAWAKLPLGITTHLGPKIRKHISL